MSEEERERAIGKTGIKSSEIEQLLKSRFNATGDGLGQKFRSVEHLLPPELSNKLRRIVPIRNKAIHEADTFQLPSEFIQDCDRVIMMLKEIEVSEIGDVPNKSQYYRQESYRSPVQAQINNVMVGVFEVMGDYIGTKLPQNRSLPSSASSFIIGGCSMIFKFFFQYIFFICVLLLYVVTLLQIVIGNFFGGDFKFLIICLAICYGIASMLTAKLYSIDRSAQKREKIRVPEAFLHLAELLGGWPILFISQQVLRQNNSHAKYQFVYNTVVIFHASLIVNIFLFQGLFWWVNLPILFLVFVAAMVDLVQSNKLM